MKRIIAALTALLLLALPSAGLAGAHADEQVGTDVSGFVSADIYGNPIDGGIFSGYAVSVVCCFATWSGSCLDQLAILQEIRDSHPGYGVFGLLYEDATSTPEAALAVIDEAGYTFPVFVCDEIWETVVNESSFIPQSFIVSREGMIVEAWHAAFQSADILLDRLELWAESSELPDGDADLNGVVDIGDALLVLRCAMGLIASTEETVLHGDMDGSGALDPGDALAILRIALNIA